MVHLLYIFVTYVYVCFRPVQLKCDKYWPEVGQALQFNNMGVSNINEEVKPSYTTRTFMLSVPQKKKKVRQLRDVLHVHVV